jgi:hypothetical protein
MASSVPNYFFLKDKLYKKIRIVKSENYLVCWSYEDEMRMRFNYSSVLREATKAYSVSEVSKLLEKTPGYIWALIGNKIADHPSGRSYNANKRPMKWYWSEQDILDLRQAIFDSAPKNEYGEPYGKFRLISKVRLLSKMREDTSYYVKNQNGEFVKVWRAT